MTHISMLLCVLLGVLLGVLLRVILVCCFTRLLYN